MFVIVFYKTPISVVVDVFFGGFLQNLSPLHLSALPCIVHARAVLRGKKYIKILLFRYKMVYFSVTTVTPLSPSPYVPRRNSLTLG